MISRWVFRVSKSEANINVMLWSADPAVYRTIEHKYYCCLFVSAHQNQLLTFEAVRLGIFTRFIMTHLYPVQHLSFDSFTVCVKSSWFWTVICVCASEDHCWVLMLTVKISGSYYPLIMIYSVWVNMSVIGDGDDYVCVFRAVMWCEVMMAAASVSQSASAQATEKSQLTLKGKKSSLFWSSPIEHQHCDWFICSWCDACVFALCCVSSRGWCALNNNFIAARSRRTHSLIFPVWQNIFTGIQGVRLSWHLDGLDSLILES